MNGPRYNLVPEIGAAKKAATEPAPEPPIKRAPGYGWAALAIATLIFAFHVALHGAGDLDRGWHQATDATHRLNPYAKPRPHRRGFCVGYSSSTLA